MWVIHIESLFWIKIIKPFRTRTQNASEDVEQWKLSFLAGGNVNGKTNAEVWYFLTKAIIFLPYNITVTVFGIYPMDLKTDVHTNACT